MVDNLSTSDYKKHSNTELDNLVIAALEHYAKYLENELNKKKSGCVNGLGGKQPDQLIDVDDVGIKTAETALT